MKKYIQVRIKIIVWMVSMIWSIDDVRALDGAREKENFVRTNSVVKLVKNPDPKINLSFNASGPSIENIRTTVEGGKIIIHYDLKADSLNTNSSDFWLEVKLYCSHNDFSSPITNVTGAIGKVTPGLNKRVEWQYGNELDNFSGDLSFEVGAEVIFRLKFIAPKQSIRRAKSNTFSWTGGRPQAQLDVELISSSGQVVWQEKALSKNGKITLQTEPKLPLGKGYHLQITSVDEKISIPITVKRQVSRFWIVSPVVLATAAALYLVLKPEPLPAAPGMPPSN